LKETRAEIANQIEALKRRQFIDYVLQKSGVVSCEGHQAGHGDCEPVCSRTLRVDDQEQSESVKAIKTAGAIFLGPYTPTVVGDYLAGPSHELPKAVPEGCSPD